MSNLDYGLGSHRICLHYVLEILLGMYAKTTREWLDEDIRHLSKILDFPDVNPAKSRFRISVDFRNINPIHSR